jgi:organic hydroperoxide reductase OsmC/OhrA
MGVIREHSYAVTVTWTGNQGTGTSGYRAYSRDHEVFADGPATIAGSSDPAFRGDRTRWNPELVLTASLSQCHMLWYLHLCAEAGIVVLAYSDDAVGTMEETSDGSGRFTGMVLRPQVEIADAAMREAAFSLHALAHEKCFIANSVNFPVRHEPTISAAALVPAD